MAINDLLPFLISNAKKLILWIVSNSNTEAKSVNRQQPTFVDKSIHITIINGSNLTTKPEKIIESLKSLNKPAQ